MNTMQRISIKTAITVFLVSMVAACAKETAPSITPDNGEKVEGDDKIEVAIDGIIDGFVPSNESKASAGNVIRIMWQGGEIVYVYDGKNYIGTLTASIAGTDGRYAKLNGTVTAPSGEKTITLVYSPCFSDRPDNGSGRIELDLSSQAGKDVPFLIYGITDSLEGTVTGVTFKPATSVFKCNCADLPEGSVSKASIGNVNTKSVITISDVSSPALGGADVGTITRSAGFTASDSRVIFSVSLAVSGASNKRTICVGKDKIDYDAPFFQADLEAAIAYNDVFVLKPVGSLPGKFSVNSSGKKVYFAKGNLWHGNDGYHIESNQNGRQPLTDGTWVPDHISHFFWSETESLARLHLYSDPEKSVEDAFFTNSTETTPNPAFGVIVEDKEQKGVWRTLSDREWQYVLNERRMTFGGSRYVNWISSVKIEGLLYRGLFIYPDDYNGDPIEDGKFTWEQINESGIAFLPAVGIRQGTEVSGVVTNLEGFGWYWSSTADDDENDEAYGMYFTRDGLTFDDSDRGIGHSVRLVRDYK